MLGIAVGGFVLALGLAYAVGHGVQALQGASEPVVCPDMSIPERFAGHFAGLAHDIGGRRGSTLAGVVPGPLPGGPEALAQVTVVQGSRLLRTGRFERVARRPGDPGGGGYHVTISETVVGGGSVVFVTSACVPEHPLLLRRWQFAETGAPDSTVDQRMRQLRYLREQFPVEYMKIQAELIGALDTAIPGCPRVGVLAGSQVDDVAGIFALLCLDAEGTVVRELVGPDRVGPIHELAALDIDGDGIDELLLTRPVAAVHGQVVVRELMWFDAAGEAATVDLGPVL